jgi:hypothetical protein
MISGMKGVKKCQLKKFERVYFSSSCDAVFLQNAHLNEIHIIFQESFMKFCSAVLEKKVQDVKN